MTEPVQNYQTSQSASVEGLDDIFTVECQGESGVTPVEDLSSQGESEGYPLAEAARKLGIPYTTFYKQVKAGKHRTIKGLDGKTRVLLPGDSPCVTPVSIFPEVVTPGVSPVEEAITEAYHLKVIEQLSAKLEGANYRIGWLESQLRERESDIEELKLLTDSQHKPSLWARFKKWCAGN